MAGPGTPAHGRRLLGAVLVTAGLLAVAPAAAQALMIDHDSVAATAEGGGLIAPASTVDLLETIHSSETNTLTNVTGTLTSPTPGVTVTQATEPYPNLTFGNPQANTTPFKATVGSGVQCGTPLAFDMQVSTDQGSAPVSFTVPTGTAGPATSYAASDLPRPIPDGGSIVSSVNVGGSGLAKGVTVSLGELDHTYDGDLKVELIGPDGTDVVLVNRRGAAGHNFVNTVFSDAASQPITAGSAPFTGTYRPEQALSAFDGHPVSGTWKLKVSDMQLGDTGVLKAWAPGISPAVCTTNPVPSFRASPSPAPPGTAVAFDASGSIEPKPGATLTRYEWDFGDGTPAQTTTSPTVTHTYAARGQVTVRLSVTDSANETGTTTLPLTVTRPPTVSLSATPNPAQALVPVALSATASDPDPGGSITKYEWDLDGDGTYETDTGVVPATSTTFAVAGTYTVRVRVTDADGATATDSVPVLVQPVGATNQPPTASLSVPGVAVVNQPVTLDAGGSSDPDGSITKYEWDFNGDGTYDQTTTTSTVSHSFSALGQVTVGVRVTDDGVPTPATATTTAKLNVVLAPNPGTVTASLPNTVSLNRTVTFTDTGANDPNAGGSITKYEWDLDGDGTYETNTGTTSSASRSYSTNGTRTVRVRVTGSAGATAVATYNLVAADQLPSVALSVTPNPATVGQPVTLSAAGSSDPDGTVVAYDWDLDGNGSYETPGGASPTYTYSYPNVGSIIVGVRVTDNDGGRSTRTTTLQVNPAATGGGTTSGGTATGGGGSTTGGGAPPPAAPPRSLRAGLTGPALQRRKDVVRRGLALVCQADRSATCSLAVQMSAREARRYGVRSRARTVGLGSARGSPAAGRDARLSLRLNTAGLRILNRARRVSLLVRGTIVDAAGGRIAVTRVVVVRA